MAVAVDLKALERQEVSIALPDPELELGAADLDAEEPGVEPSSLANSPSAPLSAASLAEKRR